MPTEPRQLTAEEVERLSNLTKRRGSTTDPLEGVERESLINLQEARIAELERERDQFKTELSEAEDYNDWNENEWERAFTMLLEAAGLPAGDGGYETIAEAFKEKLSTATAKVEFLETRTKEAIESARKSLQKRTELEAKLAEVEGAAREAHEFILSLLNGLQDEEASIDGAGIVERKLRSALSASAPPTPECSEHIWIRYHDPKDPELESVVWCRDCGVHRVEVATPEPRREGEAGWVMPEHLKWIGETSRNKRCSCCHAPCEPGDGRWRFNGREWEHKCEHVMAQCGHFEAELLPPPPSPALCPHDPNEGGVPAAPAPAGETREGR